MMRLVRLTIQDWGPFRGRQVFEFPQGPGLYFLWGRNEAEPRLGSNGAGKSRLWEAICWLFFGKTSRGIKAGDAANWEVGKGAEVSLEYVVDGDLPCTATRSWSPNRWVMVDWTGTQHDLAKDSANQTLSHLGLSFAAFLNTVWMPQRADMFLDLKPDAKAAMFSELLGLDRWLDRSKKASTLAIEADASCRRLEKDVARITGQLDQIDDHHVHVMHDDWEAKTRARITELERLLAEHLTRRKTAKQLVVTAEEADAAARDELAARIEAHRALLTELAGLKDVVAEASRALTKVGVQRDAVDGHVHFLCKNDHCPTCDQDLDPVMKRENVSKARRTLADLEREEAERAATYKRLIQSQNSITDEADKVQVKVNKQRGVVEQAEFKLRDARQALARLDRDLDDWEDELDALAVAKNPYAELLSMSADRRQALKRDLSQAQRLLDEAEGRHVLFTYWVRGFKEIRLEMIGDALTQLEIEVNSEVSAVGLVGWELRFDVDRETKGGSIQRGFSVHVVSPHNKRPVPWEAWSGGESQRLRMAAQAGLANLSRASTGADINLEVWDEPTDGLGQEGVLDLLKTLETRAVTEQRQIWVVDHHSLSFGGFSGAAGVVKTRKGSHFDLAGLYISGRRHHDQPQPQNASLRSAPDELRLGAPTPRTRLKEGHRA